MKKYQLDLASALPANNPPIQLYRIGVHGLTRETAEDCMKAAKRGHGRRQHERSDKANVIKETGAKS